MRNTAVVGAAIAMALAVAAAQAQVGVERKILLQQDLEIPGYQTLLVQVTVAVGGREGVHTHPGTLIAQLLEGELTLEVEGHPTRILKAGDAVLIEPGRRHEGVNTGNVPVKALATFIVEKDKPVTTQVR